MTQLSIAAADRSGSFSAYAALPEGGKGPGLIVIQEIFGVNKFARQVCDHYANLGYVAVAPDLFWRIEPGLDLDPAVESQNKKGFELFGKFDVGKGVEDLDAMLRALRGHEACAGRVGAVGYCLGGKLAYLLAARSDVDAAVGYYGVGIQDMPEEAAGITTPLMLHIAEQDKFTPPDAQARLKETLGGHPLVTLRFYPGMDHAFARVGGDHYDAAAAKLADRRTEAFFAEHLR